MIKITIFSLQNNLTRRQFSLCFEVSIQETGNRKLHRAAPLIIPAGKGGQGFSGYFSPEHCMDFAAGREGKVEVRIILKPSRAMALTDTRVKNYYTGTITSEPMHITLKNTSSP